MAGVDQDVGNVSKKANGSSIFQTKIWKSTSLIFEKIWGIKGNYGRKIIIFVAKSMEII
jgi:hypothetical protein